VVIEARLNYACSTVAPETLPDRLPAAGFHDVEIEVRQVRHVRHRRQRWRSVKAWDVDSHCVD
jgi:hypothetical protein